MAFNNLTSRSDAQALVPEEVSKEMLGKATTQSATLQLFRRIPVARNQIRFPVLSALPIAYFVSGDTGLKQTTEVNWANKYMNIEEIATILPVPDAVAEDVDANIWDEAMPLLTEAFGRTLDAATFFGTNAPASWPTYIQSAAASASNSTTSGTAASAGGYFGDIDKVLATVESDGYEVSGFVAATSARAKLRSARDAQGRRLDETRVTGDLNTIDGKPVSYAMRGMFGTGTGSVQLFAGDFTQFVIGVRQDITVKVLDQAVIQDNTGAIVYNLAQQDLRALRMTFRVGWQVANTINYDQAVEANRYPVGTLLLP